MVGRHLEQSQFSIPFRSVHVHTHHSRRSALWSLGCGSQAVAHIDSAGACSGFGIGMGSFRKHELSHRAVSRGNDFPQLLWRQYFQFNGRYPRLRGRIHSGFPPAETGFCLGNGWAGNSSAALDARQSCSEPGDVDPSESCNSKLAAWALGAVINPPLQGDQLFALKISTRILMPPSTWRFQTTTYLPWPRAVPP